MPTYLIERDIPGAHGLTAEQFQGIARTSCRALRELGPDIQWVQSFVTDDKITCVYIASDESIVYEHARITGFPAHRVSQICTMINPTTAEPSMVTAMR
jgi:hypothetical protein